VKLLLLLLLLLLLIDVETELRIDCVIIIIIIIIFIIIDVETELRIDCEIIIFIIIDVETELHIDCEICARRVQRTHMNGTKALAISKRATQKRTQMIVTRARAPHTSRQSTCGSVRRTRPLHTNTGSGGVVGDRRSASVAKSSRPLAATYARCSAMKAANAPPGTRESSSPPMSVLVSRADFTTCMARAPPCAEEIRSQSESECLIAKTRSNG
jgi:hypothetical protein